jgi:predicted Zn-dependent protease
VAGLKQRKFVETRAIAFCSVVITLILCFCLGLFLPVCLAVTAQSEQNSLKNPDSNQNLVSPTPPLPHPLPSTLMQWQDASNSGDYFSAVRSLDVGYLVWSQFPVKIYLEAAVSQSESEQAWVKGVLQAIEEWGVYLPLEVVGESRAADIIVMRSRPPLRATLDRTTGQFQLERARTAEASYQLYRRQIGNNSSILSHKFTVRLNPNQPPASHLATARHEIGHALGIWGHSPSKTDALYYSQVKNPPPISPRDINTLKRIYQQPTRLGWVINNS